MPLLPIFRYLAGKCSNVYFSFEKRRETEGLHKLILDGCQKDYKTRIDPVTALRASNAEKSLLTSDAWKYEVIPLVKIHQKRLIEPIGIDGTKDFIPVNVDRKMRNRFRAGTSTTGNLLSSDSTFSPPDGEGFTSEIQKSKQETHEKKKDSEEDPISPSNREFLAEILDKVNHSTNFETKVLNEYFQWKIGWVPRTSTYKNMAELFQSWNPNGFYDLNSIRRKLCDDFCNEYNQMSDTEINVFAETSKKILSEENCSLYFLVRAWVQSKDLDTFTRLMNFDLMVQNLCFLQAFHTLIETDLFSFSNWDLLRLIRIAIQNIEEVDKIFTKRFYFGVCYMEDSRDEWCESLWHLTGMSNLYFKKSLTEFKRSKDEFEVTPERDTKKEVPIDVETVRRALYEKRAIVESYILSKMSPCPFKVFRPRRTQTYEAPPECELDLQKQLDPILAAPFPTYFFDFDNPPLRGEGSERIGGYPLDLSTEQQIPIFQNYTTTQIEYIEMYPNYVSAIYLVNLWKNLEHSPETLYLIESLLERTAEKREFRLPCVYYTSKSNEGIFLKKLKYSSLFLNREFQIIKDDKTVKNVWGDESVVHQWKPVGIIEIEFGDLMAMLEELATSLRNFHRSLAQRSMKFEEERQMHFSRMKEQITCFWKKQSIFIRGSCNVDGKEYKESTLMASLENPLPKEEQPITAPFTSVESDPRLSKNRRKSF